MRHPKTRGIAGLMIVLCPTLAFAHPGHTAQGFAAGMAHPLTGLDHLLAMLAVGMWATHLGGRARWLVPAAFLALMAVGGTLPHFHAELPMVESGILASVFIMGLILMFAIKPPLSAGVAVAGLFAVFHGYAHGAELPANAAAAWYAAGFLSATALLLGIGAGAGYMLSAVRRPRWVRACGGAMVAAGLLLALGVL